MDQQQVVEQVTSRSENAGTERERLELERREIRAQINRIKKAPLSLDEQLARVELCRRQQDAGLLGRFAVPLKTDDRDEFNERLMLWALVRKEFLGPKGGIIAALRERAETEIPGLPNVERPHVIADLEAKLFEISVAIERCNAQLDTKELTELRDNTIGVEVYEAVYGDRLDAFKAKLRSTVSRLHSRVDHGGLDLKAKQNAHALLKSLIAVNNRLEENA